jgi:hypothetical protein
MDAPNQTGSMTLPFLHLSVLFEPLTVWTVSAHMMEAIFVSQSTNSTGTLVQKYHRRHAQKCLPTIGASHGPGKLTYKINH